MIREDFFTGEPVPSGSPSLNESEAADMASFGSYSYDPAQRQQMIMSAPYNTGQPPGGIGYNPYMQPGGYQYQGYYNPYYQGYNPYYQNPYYQQQQQYGYQQPEYIEYKIEPLQPSGEFLPEVGYESTINDMQRYYMTKEIEVQAEQAVERSRSGYGSMYGTNYYGRPYFYNPYAYNQVNIELQAEIDRMKEEARQRRFDFNFRLSRLAHNIARDGISDEAITERYTGKTIVEKNKSIIGEVKAQYDVMRFENMVPVNNSQSYRDHDAQITREFNESIPADADLDSFLKNSGVLKANMMMEEEKHRRKNSSVLYNHDGNTYKMFVAEQAARRYRERKGYSEVNTDTSPSPEIPSAMFPTLSQSARLSDDGTLNITCNFGSQKGKSYNVNENKYEEKRAQFASFLQSIPGSILREERGANDGR